MASMMDAGAAASVQTSSSLSLDDSHVCPVCREVFSDAFSTLCGHTFCFACITEHLKHMQACPCCSQVRNEGCEGMSGDVKGAKMDHTGTARDYAHLGRLSRGFFFSLFFFLPTRRATSSHAIAFFFFF